MEGNSPERDVPPRSRGNLNSSYISSTELSSFLENEEASASVSVAGRKGFPAVQANRDDVRVTERDAGGGENESSGSRKRNRVPYPLRGKIGEYRTHRGRPLTLSLLVLSLLFLILRRLVVKCGYLFSKPHDPGNIETFTEGSVHRLLASVGVGNEEGGEQATSPPSSLTPSLEACTKEEQEVIFSSPSMSSEGTREAEEQLTGQETFAAPEGIEVQDRGRKRKTRHEADEDDHMGASPPSKQSRRDLSEVLRAYPHILAVLLEPLSSDDTTSPTKSERQAEEEAGPSVAPGAARQAAVVQELSDSEDEGEPERLLARPVGEEGIPLTDEGPGTSAQDEHIDVEDYDDEDDDFLSKADVSLDPASVQLFRRYAGPYLSSIILDTPEKQAQWIKSGLAFTPTQHSIRQGFIQLKRTSNKNLTALLHIFKSLLMLQFYIVRAVLVSRAHFHSMDKAVMARLRRAQVFMETALLRTGIPPAYIYPAQTFLTQLVAGLSRPLNFVALLRARGQEELPKPQRGNNAKSQEEGRKSQKGDNPIAKQLAADRSVLLHMVGEQSWVPALTRWLSRQPPDFAEAVPRESAVGKLMRLWSLLPDEETSSSTGTHSEDTSPTDWTGETEEDWLDTEDPNRTANAQLVPVYLGKAYKPLASLRDLLPIFRPLLTPEVVSLHPYAVHGPDGIRWREQMGAILVSLRGALWFRLKSLRDLQHKKDAAMQSLLRVLALTDFALSQARFAMETRPEIKEDADFLWACSRAERSAYYAWARIGLYRKATAWARRGLAAIVAGTLYHPHRTQTERQIASEPSLVMRDLKTRLAGIDIARQLAEWMRQNPDPSAAIDIVTHSRLFRHFAQAESRGKSIINLSC
ncbi:hypothetical protein CSUI_008537 [Cystoisospora suis]|uniref:Uncharacterized protein n=1 Tax=Cystoisospora suis TaxID=483139 RepID=A0A2C6K8T4_9APIC|nr:hypothetical protein CSUI_008537 [Cystoisospora suis]